MYKYINLMQTDTNGVVEYQSDVFLAPWFNCAGFLVHTLPNIILFSSLWLQFQYNTLIICKLTQIVWF